MFGTVVVGIGITGRVRIRDLLSPLPSSASEKMSIKGFVSRAQNPRGNLLRLTASSALKDMKDPVLLLPPPLPPLIHHLGVRKHRCHSPDQIKIWDTVLHQQGILTELIQGWLALPSQASKSPCSKSPLSYHQRLEELEGALYIVASEWVGDRASYLEERESDIAPLQQPSLSAELIPLMQRTLDNQQGVKQITLEEALDREDIQAAIICTENITHEEYIRKFLDAGKHVCVEYPMSLSVAVARELWDLADRKGKVLHEEHIEILTADYKQLKKEVSGKELLEGTLHFTGGHLGCGDHVTWVGWEECECDEMASTELRYRGPFQPGFGFASFGGIARLTWLVDLFGELTLTAAEMEEQKENKYMKLTAQFLTKEKRPLTWIEERAPGLGRVKNINFRFDSGTLDHIPNGPQEPVGLFMQDLNWFGEKLLGQVNSEQLQVERRRILHCLELADRIKELCQKPAQNNF
ncbi:BIEA reductase, partial [Polyodon spathula]|nr:BIEA reductase [Polyodon spathula]